MEVPFEYLVVYVYFVWAVEILLLVFNPGPVRNKAGENALHPDYSGALHIRRNQKKQIRSTLIEDVDAAGYWVGDGATQDKAAIVGSICEMYGLDEQTLMKTTANTIPGGAETSLEVFDIAAKVLLVEKHPHLHSCIDRVYAPTKDTTVKQLLRSMKTEYRLEQLTTARLLYDTTRPPLLLLVFAACVIKLLGSQNQSETAVCTCHWELNQECMESPTGTLNFKLQFADHANFPDEFEGPLQAAVDFWSHAIVSTPTPAGVLNGKTSLIEGTPVILSWVIEKVSSRVKDLLQAIADLLSRSFSGWEIHVGRRTAESCGFIEGTYIYLDNTSLLLCVRSNESFIDEPTLGTASILRYHEVTGLPIVSLIDLNPSLARHYDNCLWSSVVTHEIAHALGFFRDLSIFEKHIVHEGDARLFRGGTNTMREWDKHNTSLSYPALEQDAAHWSGSLLGNDLMSPTINVQSCYRNRANLSSLTLAVFEDLGYDVNYKCADEVEVHYP